MLTIKVLSIVLQVTPHLYDYACYCQYKSIFLVNINKSCKRWIDQHDTSVGQENSESHARIMLINSPFTFNYRT